MKITVKKGPGWGPICTKAIGTEEAAICHACQARHHATCYREAGRCGECQAETPVPSTTEPMAGPTGEPQEGAPTGPHEAAEPAVPSDPSEPEATQPEEPSPTLAGIPPGEEPRWLDQRRNLLLLAYGVFVVCGFMILLPEVLWLADVYEKHGHYGAEDWPGFYSVFGFAAYSLVVVLGLLLRRVVMRGEGYYDA